ncbi:MAG: MBL fold metallo-hydrolase [Candidatus Limivicinus sp.]|jgi:hydroxyacylglutathione hydrolase
MLIKTIPVGQLETNCYVVTNEENLQCVIIDPGDESNVILDYIEDNSLSCQAILLTHGHFDHVGAVNEIVSQIHVPVYMNELDDSKNNAGNHFLPFTLPENGKYYGDGDTVEAAGFTFKVISTPGHTPGGVTLIVEDAIFPGDTLFKGSAGRADFPGSSIEDEMRSLKRICELEGDYEVYPGHMDSSTLERERAFNYYCREAMNNY